MRDSRDRAEGLGFDLRRSSCRLSGWNLVHRCHASLDADGSSHVGSIAPLRPMRLAERPQGTIPRSQTSSHIRAAEGTMNVTLLPSGDHAGREAEVQSGLFFSAIAFDPSAFMTTKENTKPSGFRSMSA